VRVELFDAVGGQQVTNFVRQRYRGIGEITLPRGQGLHVHELTVVFGLLLDPLQERGDIHALLLVMCKRILIRWEYAEIFFPSQVQCGGATLGQCALSVLCSNAAKAQP
jgi:hypothetical protein